MAPNQSFAMGNVLRSHSTRKDHSILGAQRIKRMSDQASKIVNRLTKESNKHTRVSKELGINIAADRTLDKLTEEEPIISKAYKGENPPMVRKLAPHWSKYFQQLDTQRSGYVSYEDFSSALLTVATPSRSIYGETATQERESGSLSGRDTYDGPIVGKTEAYQLAKLLDKDKTGLINYHNLVPSLVRAVGETKKDAEEKSISNLSNMSVNKMTSPILKVGNTSNTNTNGGSINTVSSSGNNSIYEHVPSLCPI